MDRTGVVLLALVAVIVTCGPLSCVIFAKIRRHRKSHPGLRQLANARNQLTAVGGCSNSLGAERLAGSGWGTLGDRSTTTASGIGVGVGVGVGADGVLVESRTPQGANSSWSVPAFRSVKPSAFFCAAAICEDIGRPCGKRNNASGLPSGRLVWSRIVYLAGWSS
ncbi:hypothetical protein HYQ45_007253 [Verticillium longisporum]|uniref:Uncharacterized protein n=1 Tax=Verticillium longisporum TaxID=100787 RepID=A0A8I2ZPM8_VERLO|nr:hypothetical protein HYQ45_007253 [Verticillium longisporum]